VLEAKRDIAAQRTPHRGLAIRGTNNSVADVSRVRLSYEAAPQPEQPRGLVQVVLNE
jgi:hypothetical protein